MIIRKLFKFENAHIVRGCSSLRCRSSIHGHSYKVEILLSSNFLDNGQMVYDFGLMKYHLKEIIDSFDHATTFWNKDEENYINAIKSFSARWVSLPVSPSAEQFARLFFLIVQKFLKQSLMSNGEKNVSVQSIIVHETDTGYAQAFEEDINNPSMGIIKLEDIVFSGAIIKDWKDCDIWNKLLKEEKITNPKIV